MLAGGVSWARSSSRRSRIRLANASRIFWLGLLLAIPGLIGLAFATSSWLLFVSAFAMGFFLVSTSPIGMQYASEVTQPTPEGTSNGLIQLFGQASVVFVYIMEAFLKTWLMVRSRLLCCWQSASFTQGVIPKTQQQIDQCGFARTTWPDDSN
jgi:MFS family permease